MANFFEVVESFQATDRETKEPITDSYGNSKWMFKVKGQGPEGWMAVNRKEGSTLDAGSHVYGIVDTWPEGKAKFVRQNPPEGERPPESTVQPSKQAPKAQGGGSVEVKLDYIISMLENSGNFQGNGGKPAASVSQGAPSNDDGNIELEEFPY